jgi:hypothetical protein
LRQRDRRLAGADQDVGLIREAIAWVEAILPVLQGDPATFAIAVEARHVQRPVVEQGRPPVAASLALNRSLDTNL